MGHSNSEIEQKNSLEGIIAVTMKFLLLTLIIALAIDNISGQSCLSSSFCLGECYNSCNSGNDNYCYKMIKGVCTRLEGSIRYKKRGGQIQSDGYQKCPNSKPDCCVPRDPVHKTCI